MYIDMNQMLIIFWITKKAFDFRAFLCLISSTEFCGSFTLTHNPIKFVGHWGCETGDALFCKCNVITWYASHVTQCLWSTHLNSNIEKVVGYCPSELYIIEFFQFSAKIIEIFFFSSLLEIRLSLETLQRF